MHLILFDVDGTLVDSQDNIVRGMEAGFRAAGLEPLERGRVLSIVGLSLPIAIAELLGDLATPERVAAVAEGYKTLIFSRRDDPDYIPPFFPGALEAIDHLASRPDVMLGIVTGKARRGLHHMLQRSGLHAVFATTWTADDAPSKPHPGMVLAAAEETGIAPERAIVIGDTSFDMEMARAAGARGLGVAWGYHPVEALRAAGASAIAADYPEALRHLDALMAQPAATRSA